MTRLRFGTKAQTLQRLAPRLRRGRVLPLEIINRTAWRKTPDRDLARIAAQSWSRQALIVRSSAIGEDRAGASQAGKYLSLRNVDPSDLRLAVDRVFASYGSGTRGQVLVQPMLQSPRVAGVAFTRDPSSGAPYITINFDRHGDTAAVTGGRGRNLSTRIIARGRRQSGWQAQLCRVLNELESHFGASALDVEFAVDRAGRIVVLQVRPLNCPQPTPTADAVHGDALRQIAERIDRGNQPLPNVIGRRTIYGVMPDWNPAEMIGLRPRPLTLSLYKDLITDSIWAYQRNNYGYRNVRSTPLIVSFHGLPYVDVRASFSSFVPAALPDDLARRLVDYYIDRLNKVPAFHDKVEFEIVLSCTVPDWPAKAAALHRAGFAAADTRALAQALQDITRTIINPVRGLWRSDRAKIDILSLRHRRLERTDLDDVSHIYWLLEDCKRYGTLPFAGLARAAFIAVQMLQSLVSAGDLSPDEHAAFLASADTVTARMHRDLAALGRSAFLKDYGHLRPGTYDILSPRYDQTPDRYFKFGRRDPVAPSPPFRLSARSRRRIDQFLERSGLGLAADSLFKFCAEAIQGREYGKFVFTRSVSDALERLATLGRRHGYSRDDLSYVDISVLQRLYASAADAGATLADAIARGREAHRLTLSINLPPLIRSADEIWSFDVPPSTPNYITHLAAEGPVRRTSDHRSRLRGAILVIPNADPGYDWVFGHGIAGLVTAYGGVNSHMAIRAAELGLPAVIGAGETLFKTCASAAAIRIDCAARRIEVLA